MQPRKLSQRGVDFLKKEEGCVLRIYKCQAGKDTIGIGHRIVDADERKRFQHGITTADAEEILRRDIAWVERCINTHVKVELTQGQFDALCSLVFNCGPLPIRGGTLGKALNAGAYDVARNCFADWVKGGAPLRTLPVLVARRAREQALWDEPDDEPVP
jgi:lysozyme